MRPKYSASRTVRGVCIEAYRDAVPRAEEAEIVHSTGRSDQSTQAISEPVGRLVPTRCKHIEGRDCRSKELVFGFRHLTTEAHEEDGPGVRVGPYTYLDIHRDLDLTALARPMPYSGEGYRHHER